jgi:hypothetical protein
MSDATTVLFGLPGVRVERVERRADGTRVVDVVTDEPTAAACPSCGVVSRSVKERVVTSPKDIPYGESRIVVRWTKVPLAMPRRLLPTEVVYALSKGRVAPDVAIRGHVECNNCSGRDSPPGCSLHLFDRIYLVR